MNWVDTLKTSALTVTAMVTLCLSACKKPSGQTFIPSVPPKQGISLLELPSADEIKQFSFNYGGETHNGFIFKANEIGTQHITTPSGNDIALEPYYFVKATSDLGDIKQRAGQNLPISYHIAQDVGTQLRIGGVPLHTQGIYVVPVSKVRGVELENNAIPTQGQGR